MLLTTCYKMLLANYCHQITNNFKKLLDQEKVENISKIATPIISTIGIYIKPTRLLELGPPNTEYNLEKRLCKGCTSVNWGNKDEIKEAMAAKNKKNNDEKNFQEKNRQLKREKQCQK